MADVEWLTTEELAAAMKPRGNEPQRPATGVPDNDIAKLLARIDKNPVPKGYHGSRHQAYVDKVMAGLKPEQRARVGQLWKEKRRLDPDMPNGSLFRQNSHPRRRRNWRTEEKRIKAWYLK